MTLPWWTVLHVWTAVVAAPATAAEPLQPIALPLPQTTDYAYELVETVGNTPFSTDPQGIVLADTDSSGSSSLQIFLANTDYCVDTGQSLAYRLGVRNNSNISAVDTTIQVTWPASFLFRNSTPNPNRVDQTTADWNVGTVSPGETLTLFFTIQASGVLPPTTTVTATAFYNNFESSTTSHSVNSCSDIPQPPPGGAPNSDKQPAIICHPADLTCSGSLPDLGPRFESATPAIICSQHDSSGCAPTNPELGVRFAEAVADILPGECAVVEDDIVASPEFHDAFIRRGKPASFYLRPLFDSGRDFSEMIHQNELGSIQTMSQFNKGLQDIHQKHWAQRQEILGRVLEGTASTSGVRGQIDQWHNDWVSETQQKQGEFRSEYQQLNEERKSRFDPIAEKAIENAETSILRACGPPPSDGGLSGSLPGVKQAYESSLDQREQAFTETQNRFVNRDGDPYPVNERTATWKQQLNSALDVFDDGNAQPLAEFVTSIPGRDAVGFLVAWNLSYVEHRSQDREVDDRIRLNNWEVALDSPKAIATACEADKQFGPEVEVTWCETGNYPEFVLPTEEEKVRSPQSVFVPGGGEEVDSQQVVGLSCGGRPGDPFWADDCSCNCNQLIPNLQDGNIRFCQSGRDITPIFDTGPTFDPRSGSGPFLFMLPDGIKHILVPTANALTILPSSSPPPFPSPDPRISPIVDPPRPSPKPITMHDIYLTTQAECLEERANHADPFF